MASLFGYFTSKKVPQNNEQTKDSNKLLVFYAHNQDFLYIVKNQAFYIINPLLKYSTDSDTVDIKYQLVHHQKKQNSLMLFFKYILSGARIQMNQRIIKNIRNYRITSISNLKNTQIYALALKDSSSCSIKIIDSYQKKQIKSIILKDEVLRVAMEKSHLYVVFLNAVWIYQIRPFEIQQTIKTAPNQNALLAISQNEIIATISQIPSQINILFLNIQKQVNKNITIFPDHRSIGSISITKSGLKIAVGDQNGVDFKIIETFTGSIIKSLRRGMNTCRVSSLLFNTQQTLLAIASNRQTVHVFSVNEKSQQQDQKSISKYEQQPAEKTSYFSKFMQVLDDYVSPIPLTSYKSVVKIYLYEYIGKEGPPPMISFNSSGIDKDVLYVMNSNGLFIAYQIIKSNGVYAANLITTPPLNWKNQLNSEIDHCNKQQAQMKHTCSSSSSNMNSNMNSTDYMFQTANLEYSKNNNIGNNKMIQDWIIVEAVYQHV